MKPDRYAIKVLITGTLVVAGICALQAYTDLVHGAVYVLITGFYLLWLLRHYDIFHSIGMLVTAGIIVGYFYGHEHGGGPLINRIFSVFIFWLAVRFTMRFRKLSEEEKKNRNQLNALFENVNEAILLIGRDGKIVMGNPGAVRIFGYSRTELQGLMVEELIPQRFRKGHDQMRAEFISGHENMQVDAAKNIFALTKDGREFPVELGLSTYYENEDLFIIAFVTDITRRKEQEAKILWQYNELQQSNIRLEEEVRLRTSELCRALDVVRNTNENLTNQISERMEIEDQLRKSQILYKAVARNFPDGIVAILNRDLKYVFVEGRELSAFALKGDRSVSKVFDGLHKVVLDNHAREIKKAFEGEKMTFELETNGKFYEVISTPLQEADRPASEVLIVIRNITRYKKYEQGLKQSLEKEKQLNVLKSRFVSNVSHEFRTPLTTILSSVFLLENYNRPDAEAQRKNHTTRIRRSVNALTELLEDFLSLEKLAEGKVAVHRSEFNLRPFLAEVIREFEDVKKSDQKISLTFEGECDLVLMDKTILGNVLNNLVSNAIKYSPPEGTIAVQAVLTEKNLTLTVTDNGMGIPENEQRHIFERFYRAHNAVNVQGTGLGLNLVKKYVTLLNGNISFQSTLNEGSTFTLSVPVTKGNESEHAEVDQETGEFA